LPLDLGEPKASAQTWTKAMKSGLQTIGNVRDLSVCCNGVGNGGDSLSLVWMDAKNVRIVLAVEVDWGNPGEIESDFTRLLSIKAYRKLLLFSTNITKTAKGS